MLSCKTIKAVNFIYIKNSIISSNTGGSTDTHIMFYLKLFKPICAKSININFKDRITTKQYSHLYFLDSRFVNNSNIQAMIYIIPASTSSNAGRVEIRNTQFKNNRNTHFIEVKGEKEIVPWEISIYVYLHSIIISLNKHYDGYSLISITNCMLYLEKTQLL